jgi:predicted ATPase/predicted  nucleic acid-binding Zn-ribbon protein
MAEALNTIFEHGSVWVKADFHLHTRADKEFKFGGKDDEFIKSYVEHLQNAGIGLGIVTNHNKFDADEFKALRKRARKCQIELLPGVELSVNDGANGVHTLIVFSDDWIADGQDYINQFLNVAFKGKTPNKYEQENGRTKDDLLDILQSLDEYGRDFFVVFAHVEANSGLWAEIKGGRMGELAKNPLIQKYALGFQKVRTHDKPNKVCRTKVQKWWGDNYPAEVEGSDPKALDEIGRGTNYTYLKLGDYGFDAVKFALTDHEFRLKQKIPTVSHSNVNAIRFEGGLLDGKRVAFSPHLNCLIGIQGSGKSSILESLRYALDIPFGDKIQDEEYKEKLLPHVLKSGGKIIVEATDRRGEAYEISRIWKSSPDVYVNGKHRPGVSIKETIISKPLYFGQKDLSAAGKGFGHDLVEKLMGDSLKPVRLKIEDAAEDLETTVTNFVSVRADAEEKQTLEEELKDVEFQLGQFDKHGVKEKLEKQLTYSEDLTYCEVIEEIAVEWHGVIDDAADQADEDFKEIEAHSSDYNAEFFTRYEQQFDELKGTVATAKALAGTIKAKSTDLETLRKELVSVKDGLKEEFAETERDLVQALEDQGVSSIQPDAYIELTKRKQELEVEIGDLAKRTGKEKTKRDAVLTAVTKLNNCWHEEFKLIAAALKTINESQRSLKVESEFKGDRTAFKSRMEMCFRGNSIRKDTYDFVSKDYLDFGEVFKDLDKAASHAKSKSEIFKQLAMDHLFDLLGYQVPNSYTVTYHGKSLSSHSLGQRASAMMLFLLSQEGNDLLLIDQPEDDLDSQTVYEEVVKLVRKLKPDQQFIFATHNANFPVLGDAETITTCSAIDDEIVVNGGNIDDKACQAQIINIMEGGPDAFERRKAIYQIWKSDKSAK